MKKNIYYWSPSLNPVGTIKSTLNSAIALSKFNKNYKINVINVCGEWDGYENLFKANSVNLINLSFSYIRFLPKNGFLKSRLSYVIIIFLSFFPLLKLLKKNGPDILVIHLLTSLPMFLMYIFKFRAKFILRISGNPKLNVVRKFFWSLISRKIFKVTCPSEELKNKLHRLALFSQDKIFFLPDAIIDIKDYKSKIKDNNLDLPFNKNKKIILAVGRLTKQKNFIYLINEFQKFCLKNDNFVLIILGDGEEKQKLKNEIIKYNLSNRIFLLGHVDNVYKYMKISDVFVLSSLWEEVGFVIVEAALSNLFVISSNCPNGPIEFLDSGKNGRLFISNKSDELLSSLNQFVVDDEILKKKIKAKKSCLKYTRFRHYKKFEKILDFN